MQEESAKVSLGAFLGISRGSLPSAALGASRKLHGYKRAYLQDQLRPFGSRYSADFAREYVSDFSTSIGTVSSNSGCAYETVKTQFRKYRRHVLEVLKRAACGGISYEPHIANYTTLSA
jgi:hypothetical protein